MGIVLWLFRFVAGNQIFPVAVTFNIFLLSYRQTVLITHSRYKYHITKKIINNETIEKSDKRFIFFHHPILICCFTILFPIPADKIALGVDDEVLDVRHNARDAQASSVLELVDGELRHIDNIEIYGSDNAVHHLI